MTSPSAIHNYPVCQIASLAPVPGSLSVNTVVCYFSKLHRPCLLKGLHCLPTAFMPGSIYCPVSITDNYFVVFPNNYKNNK